MVQNGILLTFTRLATICLCFLDVRLSFLCLSFPSSRKLHHQVSLSKQKRSRTGEQLESVSLLASLQYQTWACCL